MDKINDIMHFYEIKNEEDILGKCEFPVDTESPFSDSETEGNDFNHEEDDFISTDDSTKWAKSMMHKNCEQNIISKLPGVMGATNGIKTIYDYWNSFYIQMK